MTAAAEAALALASKVCAWEFAPPGKTAQRDVLLRYAENVDVASLEALLATGCVPPARAGTAPQPCALLGCLADVVHPDRGETLLHRLFACGAASPCEAVERAAVLLVRRGGLPPSARDLLGRTPLHALVLSPWGSSVGLRRLVEGLLQLGADAEACDAGGAKASALLKERANAVQRKLAGQQEGSERARLAAVQGEQLAAMLLLTGQQQGASAGAGAGGASPQLQLGSPITAYPGIFLSRTLVPYAVLLVAKDAALLPRSEVKTQLLPLCDSREKMLDALEGCCDPTQGYRAACALGPFMGHHGLTTARALVAVWKRAALQASQAVGEGEAGGRRGALGCLARCHSFVAASGEGEQQQQQQAAGSREAPCCPFPGECEFHALAVAHALWKDKALKRYSGTGDKWKLWHELAKEALAAGGAAPAAVLSTAKGEVVSTLQALAPLLTPFGELLLKHGRRDFPAPAALPAEEVATAGLTEDLRAPCLGLGSPSRPNVRTLGGGGRAADKGDADAALSALVEATKTLHF
jgi:hypothetical protein